MENFTYFNPVKIVFGKGMIAELKDLIPADAKVLMLYGGGSIKKNGVYDQVRRALSGHAVVEFGGIEPNPRYETCMKAAALAQAEGAGFLLAVGAARCSTPRSSSPWRPGTARAIPGRSWRARSPSKRRCHWGRC